MKTFDELVREEVGKARGKHKPINSVHEGYAVLLEEVDEFWEWVRKKTKERDPNEMLIELVQISAMAQRCAEDVVIPMLEEKTELPQCPVCNQIGGQSSCGYCNPTHQNGKVP